MPNAGGPLHIRRRGSAVEVKEWEGEGENVQVPQRLVLMTSCVVREERVGAGSEGGGRKSEDGETGTDLLVVKVVERVAATGRDKVGRLAPLGGRLGLALLDLSVGVGRKRTLVSSAPEPTTRAEDQEDGGGGGGRTNSRRQGSCSEATGKS